MRVSLPMPALLLALIARGQQPAAPAEPTPLAALLMQLQADDLDAGARDALVEVVLARGPAAGIALFDVVRRRCADLRKQLATRLVVHHKRFAKEVPATLRSQLGRRGPKKLAELRDRALAISRSPDLDKARIHDQLDPLLQEICGLALVTPGRVLLHDRALAAEDAALRALGEQASEWFLRYLHVMHAVDQETTGRRHVDRFEQEPEPGPAAAALDDEYARLVLAALPLSGRDAQAMAANLQLRASMEPEEFAGTMELNRIRIALGLPVLAIDEKLGLAARDHSQDMRTLGFFSHESPVAGKRSFGDRAARAGTSASAENIAAGQPTGLGAITAWWYSPGHHKNMLGGHARTGLGRSEGLWTQMFGG